MNEPSLDDLIAQLKNGNMDERANAAFLLGRSRERQIVQPLIEAVTDHDAGVRVRVLEALATRDEPEIVPPIMALLHSDPHADVRRTAARALGHIEDPRPVALLSKVLVNDTDEFVRAQAAEALGAIGASAASGALADALKKEMSGHVRRFIQQALVTSGGKDVVNILMAQLTADADPDTLLDVLETLGQLRDPHAAEAIAPFQEHDDPDVMMTAKWALSVLKA